MLAKVPGVVKGWQQASAHFAEPEIQSESLPELDSRTLSFLRDTQQRLGFHDIFLINKSNDIAYSQATKGVFRVLEI